MKKSISCIMAFKKVVVRKKRGVGKKIKKGNLNALLGGIKKKRKKRKKGKKKAKWIRL